MSSGCSAAGHGDMENFQAVVKIFPECLSGDRMLQVLLVAAMIRMSTGMSAALPHGGWFGFRSLPAA